MVARLRLLISFYDDTKRDDTESHKTFYFGQGELALASIQAAVVTEGQRLRDLNTKSNSLANNPALQPGNKITIP